MLLLLLINDDDDDDRQERRAAAGTERQVDRTERRQTRDREAKRPAGGQRWGGKTAEGAAGPGSSTWESVETGSEASRPGRTHANDWTNDTGRPNKYVRLFLTVVVSRPAVENWEVTVSIAGLCQIMCPQTVDRLSRTVLTYATGSWTHDFLIVSPTPLRLPPSGHRSCWCFSYHRSQRCTGLWWMSANCRKKLRDIWWI